MIVSIICLCGLPMIVGVFLVENLSGADMDPEPVPHETMSPESRKMCHADGIRRKKRTQRTGVERASGRVGRVRVGQDEFAPGVGGDVRVGLGVLLVVCSAGEGFTSGPVGFWGDTY